MKKKGNSLMLGKMLVVAVLAILVMEGCRSEKRCGCGVDLYSRYKAPKR